jgi:hypothetical protein
MKNQIDRIRERLPKVGIASEAKLAPPGVRRDLQVAVQSEAADLPLADLLADGVEKVLPALRRELLLIRLTSPRRR